MSLFRQLWLVIIVSMAAAFGGSFVLSMLTARHYLEQQLAVKNSDNAASLALSMSQLPKDPVTVELQVAALFDSGQYAVVRFDDPDGTAVAERQEPSDAGDVPPWFVRLFPIESAPGQAQVSDGWHQFGTVHLVSHSRYAYQELWNGGIRLLLWFASGGLILGLLGSYALTRVKRPLNDVVQQAKAISERRFITIKAPRTPELKSLALAMNAMVERLKGMFAEEAARLEQVRREANLDSLTGLANRPYFMNQLQLALERDDAPPSGMLFILRLADLTGINRRCGREGADEALRRTAEAISAISERHPGALCGRMNGADFALLVPGLQTADELAEELLAQLRMLEATGLLDDMHIGHVAAGRYLHEASPSALLGAIDQALAAAEAQGPIGWAMADTGGVHYATTSADWRRLLDDAIRKQRLLLVDFPVVDAEGRLLHHECPLRLQAEDERLLAAGSFMPMAARLSMTAELDFTAVRLAIRRIAGGMPTTAVNLSGESVQDPVFRKRLQALLAANRGESGQLWLEVAEMGAFEHFADFRDFCRLLQPLGCRLGIEHFGRRFSEIGRLHDIGLDYLKVDGSFIRGIDTHAGNQAFLKGLCSIAHNIGLTVIAEGVYTAEELAALPSLGFDGATGPAIVPGAVGAPPGMGVGGASGPAIARP